MCHFAQNAFFGITPQMKSLRGLLNLYCVVKGRSDLKTWKKATDFIINNALFFETIIKWQIIYCKEVTAAYFTISTFNNLQFISNSPSFKSGLIRAQTWNRKLFSKTQKERPIKTTKTGKWSKCNENKKRGWVLFCLVFFLYKLNKLMFLLFKFL